MQRTAGTAVYHLCGVRPEDERSGSQTGAGLTPSTLITISFLYLLSFFPDFKEKSRDRKKDDGMSGIAGV